MYKVTGKMLTEEQIKEKVYELGKKIEEDFKGEDLLVVGILKGASVFVSDLIRCIDLDVNIDFMSVTSYGNSTESSGTVKILKDLDVDIEGKNVLIVEDIIDSGLTLSNLVAALKTRNPKSLKLCTLLDKPQRRKANIPVDYVGFVIGMLYIGIKFFISMLIVTLNISDSTMSIIFMNFIKNTVVVFYGIAGAPALFKLLKLN